MPSWRRSCERQRSFRTRSGSPWHEAVRSSGLWPQQGTLPAARLRPSDAVWLVAPPVPVDRESWMVPTVCFSGRTQPSWRGRARRYALSPVAVCQPWLRRLPGERLQFGLDVRASQVGVRSAVSRPFAGVPVHRVAAGDREVGVDRPIRHTAPRALHDGGHQGAMRPRRHRPTYALRGCSRAWLAASHPVPASGPQAAAGGDRWLLTAGLGIISGHAWTHRSPCVGHGSAARRPSIDLPLSGRTYPELPRIVRAFCAVAGR